MLKKAFLLAAGVLLLSVGMVRAATVTDNLNLRSGPGIRHNVIGAIPLGSGVQVLRCGRSWCRVGYNGTTGNASRKFISAGGPTYAAASSVGAVAPTYGYGYAQTGSSSWAPNPGIGYGDWGGGGYSRYSGYR